MSEGGRMEKLAAARKKLKQFQQKGKGKKKNKKGSTEEAMVIEDHAAEPPAPEPPAPEPVEQREPEVQTRGPAAVPPGPAKYMTIPEPPKDRSSPVLPPQPHHHQMSALSMDNISAAFSSEPAANTRDVFLERSSSFPNISGSQSSGDSTNTVLSNGMPTASTESLQQLSRHINGLLSETASYFEDGEVEERSVVVSQLEERNRELATLLEKQTVANQQYQAQLEFYKQQTDELQVEISQTKTSHAERQRKELAALREQLQVHVQTIGILVAEKTELSSQMTQNQRLGERKQEDIEELSVRLKASRQRVSDLEKEYSEANTSSQKLQSSGKELNKELDRLKLELYKINKSHDDMKEQNAELSQKLTSKVKEHDTLEQRTKDLRHSMEMAELKIQQLSSEDQMGELSGLLERIKDEKLEYQRKLEQSSETIDQLVREREVLSTQYQQYTEQQSQQIQQLTGLLQQHAAARGELEAQMAAVHGERDSLNSRIGELETLAASAEVMAAGGPSSPDQREMEDARERVDYLQQALAELQQQYDSQQHHSKLLAAELAGREAELSEARASVSQLGNLSVDQDRLLHEMQSDKAALSRATEQNVMLKDQLAELQNAFVKMSNDNMELATRLESESRASQQVGQRLGSQEEMVQELRTKLGEKEAEVHQLQERAVRLSEQLLLEDRAHHSEASGRTVETLQSDLDKSQDFVNQLSQENIELRQQLAEASSRSTSVADDCNGLPETNGHSFHGETMSEASDTSATVVQFNSLRHAMQMLQGKFSSAMREKADLVDKNEQLEHVVMQLQNETDTIGEYVSLYQQKRWELHNRELQKDEYIQRLARDREELTAKLGHLQALVMRLLQQQNKLTPYSVTDRPERPLPSDGSALVYDGGELKLPADVQKETSGSFGKSLSSSKLEDWTDMEQDTDTEGEGGQAPYPRPQGSTPTPGDVATPDTATAHEIMSLLAELGHSNLVEPLSQDSLHVFPCRCCSGKLLVV